MRTIKDFKCIMRDGVKLSTDLYLPQKEGKYPLILMRTPYNKNGIKEDPLYGDLPRLTANGYVVAIQDVRGACASEGVLEQNGGNETKDGYDAVEFLAAQDFCDGNVGTYGLSYFGFTQLAAANMAPPHLKAITPFMCCSLASFGTSEMQTVKTFHLGWAYGQVLERAETYIPDPEVRERLLPILKENMAHLGEYGMILPMTDNPAANVEEVPVLTCYKKLLLGVEDKAFWDSIDSPMNYDRMNTAMLHGTGWSDAACQSTIDNFIAARRSGNEYTRENSRLLIGPWTHGSELPYLIEGIDYNEENSGKAQDVLGQIIRFFDKYLKGQENVDLGARVKYFVMGENEWHTAPDWPPTQQTMMLYPAADGSLAEEIPAAGIVPMVYDPADPAPSGFQDKAGRRMNADWGELSSREDIVEFIGAPLMEDTTVAGTVRMTLKACTDVEDTDFVCRLLDVAPDGYKKEIGAGMVRARHRNGLFTCDFLTPGEAEIFKIQVCHAAYRLEKGHAIGIQLCGSMFPASNRNLNTTEAPSTGKDFKVAHDEILCGAETYIEIPLL